ncbi:MAG: YdcF family protein [Candidatus Saganbacteria bacterium]|nr:YdcF family protein [Candidatus Saganbacteria bacterium]
MKRLKFWLTTLLLGGALVFFSYPFLLNGLGRWLVVEDKLAPADAIIVLAGDTSGERVAGGVELYRRGYAGRLIMSGGPLAWQLSNAGWMKKQAVTLGVPAAAIIVQERSRSTLEDARFSLPLAKARGFKTVIVVTSPYHTRRAAAVFKKIFGRAGVRVLVWPVRRSDFNPDRWWTRHEDTGYVVWEYVARVMYLLKGY